MMRGGGHKMERSFAVRAGVVAMVAAWTVGASALETGRPVTNYNAARAAGALSTPGCSEDNVGKIYHDYPYPPRDPQLEIPGVVSFRKHEDPNLLRSVLYGGAPLAQKFHALVVGGGTGDATIHLALGLARVGARRSTIYHVDLSQTSIDIASERLQKHRRVLRKAKISVKFRLGRVSELLNLVGRERRFHYINAVGVLHHLPDPLQGLKTLSRLLTEDGAMSLALYGSVGRTGVYHLRELARLVAASREAHSTDSLATGAVIPTIEDAEAVMKSLPTSSMFAKNTNLHRSVDVTEFGLSGLADMIVNPCDTAFSIKDVDKLVTAAGLRIHQAVEPERYDPVPPYPESVDNLPWLDRASFAELQKGDILLHHLWLTREKSSVESADRIPWSAESILCLADWVPDAFRESMGAQATAGLQDPDVKFQAAMGGSDEADTKESGGLPALGPALLSRIDCKQTIERHFQDIAAEATWDFGFQQFLEHAHEWQRAMQGARAVLQTFLE